MTEGTGRKGERCAGSGRMAACSSHAHGQARSSASSLCDAIGDDPCGVVAEKIGQAHAAGDLAALSTTCSFFRAQCDPCLHSLRVHAAAQLASRLARLDLLAGGMSTLQIALAGLAPSEARLLDHLRCSPAPLLELSTPECVPLSLKLRFHSPRLYDSC